MTNNSAKKITVLFAFAYLFSLAIFFIKFQSRKNQTECFIKTISLMLTMVQRVIMKMQGMRREEDIEDM